MEQTELDRWRTWAQFTYLGGGPPSGNDEELRAAVCAVHDLQVLEASSVWPWQTIKTAPKDGTLILGYCPDSARCMISVAWSDVGFACGACWNNGEYSYRPTHWVPLPKPPTEDGCYYQSVPIHEGDGTDCEECKRLARSVQPPI